MSIQKLYRNGNSVAVTIRKDYLEQLGWKVGEQVRVEFYPISKVISIDSSKKRKRSKYVDPEFFKAFEYILKKHGPVFKDLADK